MLPNLSCPEIWDLRVRGLDPLGIRSLLARLPNDPPLSGHVGVTLSASGDGEGPGVGLRTLRNQCTGGSPPHDGVSQHPPLLVLLVRWLDC